MTKASFLGLLGLSASESWTAPAAPLKPAPLVEVLRGDANDTTMWRGFVEAWKFTTFGQPRLARASGRWYYELEILKFDWPQVGWADEGFAFDDGPCDDGVGDDTHGWGVDGARKRKWHDGPEDWDRVWPKPVTVGCAIDLDSTRKRMFFAMDGIWEEAALFEDFSFEGSIYPAASGIQTATFHFAKEDCRFSPPDDSYQYLSLDNGIHTGCFRQPASP